MFPNETCQCKTETGHQPPNAILERRSVNLQKQYGGGAGGDNSMKLWVPVTLGGLIAIAYAFFYELSLAETQGAASFSLANSAGIVAVFVGLIAAGFILRRATPPQ
jgi:hypothetical protein